MTTTSPSSFLSPFEQAKEYSSYDFSVLKIEPRSKQCLIQGWQRFSVKKTSKDQLAEWFDGKNWHETNIAIVAGRRKAICDVDRENS